MYYAHDIQGTVNTTIVEILGLEFRKNFIDWLLLISINIKKTIFEFANSTTNIQVLNLAIV